MHSNGIDLSLDDRTLSLEDRCSLLKFRIAKFKVEYSYLWTEEKITEKPSPSPKLTKSTSNWDAIMELHRK